MKVFCLLVVIACVYAQQHTPCVSPQQWQATLRRYDQTRQTSTSGAYYYDAVNNRIAEQEYFDNKGTQTRLWIIDLWYGNPPQRYVVNQSTTPTVCTKSPLTGPFFTIASGETYDDDTFFGCGGFPDGGFEAFNSYNNTVNGSLHTTFSSRGCVPIQAFRVVNTTVPNDVTSYYWSNVVLGIVNPNVFVPPPECR